MDYLISAKKLDFNLIIRYEKFVLLILYLIFHVTFELSILLFFFIRL